MMNQNLFSHDCRANRNVLIQVTPPSEEQLEQAKLRMSEALNLAAPPPRPTKVPKSAAVAGP